MQSFDQVTAQPLAGTEGASYPFWSPDGRAIGFFADGKLKRIDLGSGAPQVLADAPRGRGGAWNRDGVLVFAPGGTRGVIMRLMPNRLYAGGRDEPRARPGEPSLAPVSSRWATFPFLRRGRATRQAGCIRGHARWRRAYARPLDGDGGRGPPPGVLLWVHQGVLVAQRFDSESKVISDEPIPVAHDVGVDDGVLRGAFAVSATGVLAHRAGRGERRQLTWVDRAGIARGTVGPPDEEGLGSPELAPDGQRVAVQRAVQGNRDVWLIDTSRGRQDRFTFDTSNDGLPLWSPDGRHVVFTALRHSAYDLFQKAANRAGDERPVLLTEAHKAPLSWSPDGRFLLTLHTIRRQRPTSGPCH